MAHVIGILMEPTTPKQRTGEPCNKPHATSEADVYDQLKHHVEVDQHGTRKYYNSAGQLHREDGPAVIYACGTMWWMKNGRLHRDDGPAVVLSSGRTLWYSHDVRKPAP